MGGLPERKQILPMLEMTIDYRSYSLFVQHVGNPKHTFSLLNLCTVEVEIGALFVQSNAMSQPHGCCNEEVGGLWVWSS